MKKVRKRYLMMNFLSLIVLMLSFKTETALSELNLYENLTLSVLYFENNSKKEELDWLSKGLADMLISDIARIKTIQVVQRENLQKILMEQKLSSAGLVDEKNVVEIGNIVGANVILSGSFTLVGETLRIDAQLVDIEKGTTIDSVSVQDKYSNVLLLEKILSNKILEMLDIRLTDKEKIDFFQLETNSIRAAKYNYEGVNAFDRGKLKKAIELYELAMLEDPNYRKARENWNLFSQKMINGSLFNVVSNERYKKEKGIEIIRILFNKLTNNGFHIEIGKLKIENFIKEFDKTDIVIPLKIRLARQWIEDFKKVVNILGGSMPRFNSYKIAQDEEVNDCFEKLIRKLRCKINLMDKDGMIIYSTDASNLVPIYVGFYDFKYIAFDYRNEYSNVKFTNIDVKETKKITSIDVKIN